MRIYHVLLVLITLVVLFDSAHAEKISSEQICFSDFSDMKPSYSLAIRTENPVINQGDNITIDVFITGLGKVEFPAKIFVLFPEGFVRDEKPRGISRHPQVKEGYSGPLYPKVFEVVSHELVDRSIWTTLIYDYFFTQVNASVDNNLCISPVVYTEFIFDSKEGSSSIMTLVLTTSENVRPGDHILNFKITYSDGESWYNDEEEITIHVNSFWEKWYIYHIIGIGIIIMVVGDFVIRVTGIRRNNRE